MPNIKTYSDHSYDLLMGDKHRIIKSVLRQLFEGIYKEIEKNCYFEQKSRDLITDFIQWPDDSKWDFNATAGIFNTLLFKNKTFDRAANQEKKGISFSIGDVEGKINSELKNGQSRALDLQKNMQSVEGDDSLAEIQKTSSIVEPVFIQGLKLVINEVTSGKLKIK